MFVSNTVETDKYTYVCIATQAVYFLTRTGGNFCHDRGGKPVCFDLLLRTLLNYVA